MKVKTLRFKDTKEFVHILERGVVATSTIPDILADTASIEALRNYYENFFPGKEIDYDNFEIVEYDMLESGAVGADIRNKLSPPLNLVALLEVYFELVDTRKIDLKDVILKEMAQTKISVEYLSKLF